MTNNSEQQIGQNFKYSMTTAALHWNYNDNSRVAETTKRKRRKMGGKGTG